MLGAILTANSLALNTDLSITSLFYKLPNLLLAEADSGGE